MDDFPVSLPGNDNLGDLEGALQVDSLCDAFELSWKDGKRPNLNEYLQTTSVPLNTLFVELVLIDISYRQKAGEAPTLEEYAIRYPHLSHTLDGITAPVAQSKETDSDITIETSHYPRLGNFELIEELGEGAFGVVWKARDTRLRRWVALKRFRNANSSFADQLLLREARAVSLIEHPNVVRVHEIGRQQNEDYVVFEYLAGGTLADWIKQRRTPEGKWQVAPQVAAQMAIQLTQGLQAAHLRQVIHRDLKPGNILLNEQGVLKLADFGLARHSETLSTIGGDGVLMGTIPYMSPEQCRSSTEVTHLSDIYSLGVVFYELLTGQRPLQGTRLELMEKIQTVRPIPPSQRAPVSHSLDNICLRALEKDPRDRYQSAAEMQKDLEAYLCGKPVGRKRSPLLRRSFRLLRSQWLIVTSLCLLIAGLGTLFASSLALSDDGKKTIRLNSNPPGARVAFIPLDSITGIPQPKRIVHARGKTPLKERLVPPGDYLVEVYLDDGNFHEVYRRVPEDRETMSGYSAYLGWRRDPGNPDVIKLVDVTIPIEPVTAQMALVPGSTNFRAGDDENPLTPVHRRVVPAFYLDVTEVPLSVNKMLFHRDGEPDLRWRKPPTSQHAYCTSWLTAVWVAELLGKRLPDEFEYELAATHDGMREFSDETASLELPPVGEPKSDVVMFDRPVYGLCSNVAEWTTSWTNATYPPYAKQRAGKLHSLSSLELRSVRGGIQDVVSGSGTTISSRRSPRGRVGYNIHTIKPELGFRCARSLRPRLKPEDFGHPIAESESEPVPTDGQ